MVDRWARLSADQSFAPERVEVQRKPLGESQVLLFCEEEGSFRLVQGVLIDVSGVREHVLFGGWPEACDERLIRLRTSVRSTEVTTLNRMATNAVWTAICPDTRVAAACTRGMPVSSSL